MKTFQEFLLENKCNLITKDQLNALEKFGDKLLDKWDIDLEFTKHFGDRLGDSRNDPCIKISEIQQLLKKIDRDKGRKIKNQKGGEAVLVDLQKDLNLPFIINVDRNGEFTIRFKTIMRKKDFKTSDKKVIYENLLKNSLKSR